MAIEWTTVPLNDNGEEFVFENDTFNLGDFLQVRSPWGDAPDADWMESQSVHGYTPRGAGNADTYVYVVSLTSDPENEIRVALIDLKEK